MIVVGTAGWSLYRADPHQFSSAGSTLARYAAVLPGTEINSTFYRRHRPDTFRRWADAVPEDFRFSVKLPKTITHGSRLAGAEGLIDEFVEDVAALGRKLGPMLVQLPPSLSFDPEVVSRFFSHLKARAPHVPLVCEPRHPSWASVEADELMVAGQVGRVGADPDPLGKAFVPGGFRGFTYLRLHGSPQKYRSSYDDPALEGVATAVSRSSGPAWCIFDNTASGAAISDAVRLQAFVGRLPR